MKVEFIYKKSLSSVAAFWNTRQVVMKTNILLLHATRLRIRVIDKMYPVFKQYPKDMDHFFL